MSSHERTSGQTSRSFMTAASGHQVPYLSLVALGVFNTPRLILKPTFEGRLGTEQKAE